MNKKANRVYVEHEADHLRQQIEHSYYRDSDTVAIPITSTLNEEEIEITSVKFPDGNLVDGDYMWDNHYILTEDIMSYIDNEFLTSEDFWLTKTGYDF